MAALARSAFAYQGSQKVGKVGPAHTWTQNDAKAIAEAFKLD